MSELIQTYATPATDDRGGRYRVHAWGERSAQGTWHGWLEFEPVAPGGRRLRTSRETTQPNREALAYWASGLQPIYFEGALSRATAAG